MSRTWGELLGDADAAPEQEEAERTGFFGRLRDSLGRSRRALTEQIAVAAFDPADDASWERLEEALLTADVGVKATAELVRRLEARGELTELSAALSEEIAALFGEPPRLDVAHRPAVILVVGVNGTGKTTTIGKLAQKLREHGREVTLGAADTFRAAAEEQLEVWAKRSGARFVGGERGGDPAAVAYDAVGAGGDVIVVDTAGRLHTQTNLMDELAKVRRVIERRLDGAPHETLLVVDATTGQNGLQQARLFKEAVGVTGVALTKLDGSERLEPLAELVRRGPAEPAREDDALAQRVEPEPVVEARVVDRRAYKGAEAEVGADEVERLADVGGVHQQRRVRLRVSPVAPEAAFEPGRQDEQDVGRAEVRLARRLEDEPLRRGVVEELDRRELVALHVVVVEPGCNAVDAGDERVRLDRVQAAA